MMLDGSNMVNGKPIIYWIGRRDETVPSDAGYVLLSNCTNITVKNLNSSGVTLVSTVNSRITGNMLSSGDYGIQLVNSSNNTVTGNLVVNNRFGLSLTASEHNTIVDNRFSNNSYFGVLLTNSHYNTLKRNDISNNGFGERIAFSSYPFEGYYGDVFGVNLLDSSNNHFTENNVTRNKQWGMRLLGSQHDNLIYLNNFIDNVVSDSLQVSMPGATMDAPPNPNRWDNGTHGNYWSDYTARYPNASEIGDTGIGDTPYFINEFNIDHYPLMNPVLVALPRLPSTETSESEAFLTALIIGAVIIVVALVSLMLLLRRFSIMRRVTANSRPK